MKVKVAEHFYSIQGEGKTAGKPAIFIRFSDCNLICGESTAKSTWRCDTIEVWKSGNVYDIDNLVDELVYKYDFSNKQIVLTGGEPFLKQNEIIELVNKLELKTKLSIKDFIEIETNCTISPVDRNFFNNQIQYNCSPKLNNSGMKFKIRYFPEIIKEFNNFPKSIFKFVVSNIEDWIEIQNDFLHLVDKSKIYLMPAADNREDYIELSKFVAELCIKNEVNFSPRHHIMIWDKKTGV